MWAVFQPFTFSRTYLLLERHGVEDVVFPRDVDGKAAEGLPVVHQVKAAAEPTLRPDVGGPEVGADPSAVIGGKLRAIDGYGRAGQSGLFVYEACEFRDTFLSTFPDTALVLTPR